MTVETDIDSLVTAVTSRKDKAVSSKAQLTANVADALSARDQAEDAANATLSIRDEASGLTTVSGATATASVGATSYADLKALAASKAETAVDVFVYDTSLDSDGGAWRYRTTGTSWYNETLNTATRGSRKEFPAVAVIVVDAVGNKVTIYDGDDPTLPMWMVFNASWSLGSGTMLVLASYNNAPMKTCYMLNGKLAVGSANSANNVCGLHLIDFIEDRAELRGASYNSHTLHNGIAERNIGRGIGSHTELPALISGKVSNVAMTVLPDAPVDPATGLPVPTIAVGTNYGVSVILDSGVVTDAGNVGVYNFVAFTDQGLWIGDDTVTEFATFDDIRSGDGWGDLVANTSVPTPYKIQQYGRIRTDFAVGNGKIYACGNTAPWGVHTIYPAYNDLEQSMTALTRPTYTTGWLLGNTKAALLTDTDTVSLVGNKQFHSDPSCDSTSTFSNPGTDWIYTADVADVNTTSPGKLHIKEGTNGLIENVSGIIPAGTGVAVTFTISNSTVNAGVRVYLRGNGVNFATNRGSYYGQNGTQTVYFPPDVVTADCWVGFFRFEGHTGTLDIDDIYIVPADGDRSIENTGLTVNGIITRSPVAEGAELVGYSGFSATNYLEQPYNSDLDFGTGDFCIMGWVYNPSVYDTFMSRSDGNGNGWYLQRGNGQFWFASTVGGGINGGTIPSTGWSLITLLQKSGTTYAYVNDTLQGTGTTTANMTIPNGVLRVGAKRDDLIGSIDEMIGKMSLWRMSATAPTAEQIRKIYEDEKHLFQPGAKCTLYDSSLIVNALAHDPVTNLLHVGTNAGRSVFDGFVRVDNTTTAVGTAISAVNGFVVEE
jgi:hypothetical protein